jgi:hypothetical protein
MDHVNTRALIAPCGMNCGICMAYLREKNTCVGCRGVNTYKPVTRVRCKIKNCTVFRSGKVKYCFECKNFPCDVLAHLDKRYRTKYHMSMIENLENIKRYGIRRFLKNEERRWTCSTCNGTICVHKGCCMSCGKKYSEHFVHHPEYSLNAYERR